MSEHHHYHNSNGGPGFAGGLVLGALIGAGLVLTLGTKRGKEIAEELKEKGLSLVEDFDTLFDELGEDVIEQDPAPPVLIPNTNPPSTQYTDLQTPNNYSTVRVEETHSASSGQAKDTSLSLPSHIETIQAQGRRLFHGIPKRK